VIESLTGRILSRGGDTVLQAGPVCFGLLISERSRRDLTAGSGEVEVFVNLQVKEDKLELVGFSRREERDLYRSLTAISGVGTRLALAILSTLSLEDLAAAVVAGDEKILATVPGVGKKTASRLLLELKDRLKTLMPAADFSQQPGGAKGDPLSLQVLGALEALGMTRSEASRILDGLPTDDEPDVETMIRRALAASAKA